MAEVGTQVNITELRDILPVGTVVRGFGGVHYTRADMSAYGWVNDGGAIGLRPSLPLVIVSRPR